MKASKGKWTAIYARTSVEEEQDDDSQRETVSIEQLVEDAQRFAEREKLVGPKNSSAAIDAESPVAGVTGKVTEQLEPAFLDGD